MGSFDDILKLAQQNKRAINQFDISSSLSQIAKTQQIWKQNLSGFNMLNDISKSLYHKAFFTPSYISEINSLSKNFAIQYKLNIPNSAFDVINSINKQHQQLFNNLKGISDIFKQNQTLTHVKNMQIALSGISGQLASVAAIQKKWDLLDDFEEITNEAIVINDKIIEDEGITGQSLTDIRNFLERIEIKVDKIDTDANAIFWKLIVILSFILSVMGEIRNWTPKPDYASKEEVESIVKQQFSIFESKLKEQKEYRITNQKCKVLLKPKSKTIVLESLPKGFEVIVLQVQHKWVYVSFISKDNLPQTGWIMKKYLDKP